MVDFFSAESNRVELSERDYGESSFQQRLNPPPPVSLSLRTRESSALALKHIFDQINSSADSAPFNNNSTNSRAFEKKDNIDMHGLDKDGQSACLQGARNQASPLAWQANSTAENEQRMRLSEFDVSFMKAHGQALSPNNVVYGSPVSTPSLLQNASENATLPVHQGFLPWAVNRPNSSSIRQPTAQLTIFYSGRVNVYDDVPADKANAIMLLAGTGNSWSTKPANEGDQDRISTQLNSPSPPHQAGTPLPVSVAMVAPTVTTTMATTMASKTMSFSMPSAPGMGTNTIIHTLSTPPPSPLFSLPAEAKPQAAPKRPHAGIELPHARKASLARFLEKRKDRVQVKQQQAGAGPESLEEKGEMSRDEWPSSPKKPCMSGLSLPTGNSNKSGNQCSSLPSTTQHPSAAAAAAAMMASN